MIVSYNEIFDFFRVAYYNENKKLIVELYDPQLQRWEMSYMQDDYQSMTGFRNDSSHRNGMAIIIHDDKEK